MKKHIVSIGLFTVCFGTISAQTDVQFPVKSIDVNNGYISKKIWLDNYAVPDVQITGTEYTNEVTLPADAIPASAGRFDIYLGKEKKRPFAVIAMPAYMQDKATGQLKRLTNVSLRFTEKKQAPGNNSAAKPTISSTPLAAGKWYKVSVPETGFYKLDYAFITNTLGVSASAINPANIRVYGNGGNMLPEDNSMPRPADLTENAVWVNDGGDGVFNSGDYVIFYATGPMGWKANTSTGTYDHVKNLYEDKAYYFINFDMGSGKRVLGQSGTPSGNVQVTSFNDYQVHDEDLVNPGKYGKVWWGEELSSDPGKQNDKSFSFTLGNVVDSVSFRVYMGSRGPGGTFSGYVNGQLMGSYPMGAAGMSDEDTPFDISDLKWKTGPLGNATIRLVYQPSGNTGSGYLNFIEINTRRQLAFSGAQLLFRDLKSVGSGNVATYQLGNATGSTQVWDVTNRMEPVRMNGSLNGNTYSFSQDAASLHEFAAFSTDQLPAPAYAGTVANQNIHGADAPQFIIVTHPDFYSAAEQLANFHRQANGMKVLVVTTQQVYNEFSSGSQDISAIRDMVKYFYDRAGSDSTLMPRNLLLFGDASYDYKDRVSNNTNFVPTFESAEMLNLINSYCNDDFFGFVDDNENIENFSIINTLDLGVGRLPVKTLNEAKAVVNKILVYKSPLSLGPWRLSTTVVADNDDNAGPHMDDAEIMDSTVINNSSIYNTTKVYEDAITFVSTPGGYRAPDANKMINDQIFKGTFLLNYNGHGNTDVLSHERILTQDDYTKWQNLNKLPFMITATCDFGRFDHPDYVSAGERLVLKADGGVITALTTTQLVYQTANRVINRDFLDAQFKHVNGGWHTFGDAFRIGKNNTYSTSTSQSDLVNFRKFALLGDPALEPDFPVYFIHTDSVRDGYTGLAVNTVSALGSYFIEGRVTDKDNNLLSWFNGNLSVVFYDKPRTVTTLTDIVNNKFMVQNNIIYKGKATVKDGKFSFAFIAPKDINYDLGKGKISYYAENGETDAAGSDFDHNVGGFSDHPVIENNPPVVRPFIEDSLFTNWGITGPNTLLFAILEDETGINVSGNSVGHDLTAVLDGDIEQPYIMNDYYETAPNTYKRGYVNFPLYNLAEGRHTLTVKAWDVNNNSGEGTINFEVVNGDIVKVRHLMNYPNPFRDKTHFIFEHNHPDEPINVEINIYNTSGVFVRKINQNFEPTGSRSNEVIWDGTDDKGALLPSGVYIYRLKMATEKGVQTLAYQKLVIVR